jgi:hypothetical protein
MAKRSTVLLLFCVMLSACTEEGVVISDVVGDWEMADDSRKDLVPQYMNCSTIVRLHSSGVLELVELPIRKSITEDRKHTQLITGSGKWELTTNVDWRTDIRFKIEKLEKGDLGDLPYYRSFPFHKAGSGSYIYYYQGDPDSSPRIKLVKKGSGAACR